MYIQCWSTSIQTEGLGISLVSDFGIGWQWCSNADKSNKEEEFNTEIHKIIGLYDMLNK